MTESIYLEARLFLAAFLLGILLIFVYDIIRIIRRIIIHNLFFIALEDFIFWCCAGLVCFALMFHMYQGRMRAFYFIGLFLGMVLYHFNLSPVIVEPVTKLIKKVKVLLKKAVWCITAPIVKSYKKWDLKQKKKEEERKAAKLIQQEEKTKKKEAKKKKKASKKEEKGQEKIKKQESKQCEKLKKKEEKARRKELLGQKKEQQPKNRKRRKQELEK